MAESGKITVKQEHLIQALLEGLSVSAAAERCQVAERTAYRWVSEPDFEKAYLQARRHLVDRSLAKLHQKFDRAVQTVDRHLDAAKTIPRDQVKAAEIIIDKTIQTAELERRIEELEAELEATLQAQEQDRMYKVTFDLRKLTKKERDALESIEDSVAARENGKQTGI